MAASYDSSAESTTSSTRGTWIVIRNLALFFVVVFWLAIGYWVYKDARRRIEDPWLVGDGDGARARSRRSSAPLIYMLFRPPEYLEDVRERELEIKAMEERLARRDAALPGLPRRGRARRSSSARSARRGCSRRA